MTSLMPETIEPVTGTLPFPKAKRKGWTQLQVAGLVHRHAKGETVSDEEREKLIDLGLVAKPQKASLSVATSAEVDEGVLGLYDALVEPERTLAIRYAIKALTALLPKRSK